MLSHFYHIHVECCTDFQVNLGGTFYAYFILNFLLIVSCSLANVLIICKPFIVLDLQWREGSRYQMGSPCGSQRKSQITGIWKIYSGASSLSNTCFDGTIFFLNSQSNDNVKKIFHLNISKTALQSELLNSFLYDSNMQLVYSHCSKSSSMNELEFDVFLGFD